MKYSNKLYQNESINFLQRLRKIYKSSFIKFSQSSQSSNCILFCNILFLLSEKNYVMIFLMIYSYDEKSRARVRFFCFRPVLRRGLLVQIGSRKRKREYFVFPSRASTWTPVVRITFSNGEGSKDNTTHSVFHFLYITPDGHKSILRNQTFISFRL